ncbi:hypothetical protein Nepgr_020600 [Nepenthes gracilis]|uniref:Beta-glucuronosyltransferase GlcAT14A n=1 Tax=Nepenthes gracilis TaxID=150966 RepID=A0AAD3SX95_NEPGR|nr:hypothetical protein Nepgr_020600 [Nepenthes gracilis]
MQNPPSSPTSKDNIAFYCLAASISFSLLFILSLSSTSPSSPSSPDPKLTNRYLLNLSLPTPPSFAYFISGSSGDKGRILRLLLSVYHPKNVYLLHLDLLAPQTDRDDLALTVQSVPIFRAAQNVHVVGKADFAYSKGSSPIASVLRGASILLRLSPNWDWFINLSATDYPLVTQDDLLHIFSFLPKELNFVNHTSYIGWRESRRLKPIIVDPGLYLSQKAPMFYATQKRELPNAFQLFTGSATTILNRKFIKYCILGSNNLPRTLLMYFANTASSLPNYFPTILCNSPQFNTTTINHSLVYASFNKPSKEEPRPVNVDEFDDMIQSGSAFAGPFSVDNRPLNDRVLDRIDLEVLGRSPGKVVPGGWCLGESNNTCEKWGDADILRPGLGAKRLQKLIVALLSNGTYRSQQCIVE